MLGDNWYGALEGGVHSPRWQVQFEAMYPPDMFPGPAFAILGNHDYQNWPGSKVEAELEYARVGRSRGEPTRWKVPARWYRFTNFQKQINLVTFIALDSKHAL